MIPLPILPASDVAASVEFYRRLGLAPRLLARGGRWAELHGASGPVTPRLALHAKDSWPEHGSPLLALMTLRPLEQVAEELAVGGILAPEGIVDEAYGRAMVVYDPDGTPIQIVEFDEELYS